MERVVVGIDGSDASREALRFAVSEGEHHGVPVVVVHAWQLPPWPPVDPLVTAPPDYAELIPRIEEGAERLLARMVEEVVGEREAGVRVEQLPVEGPPAGVLLDTARRGDLLVVGSRGHGGFTRLLLGSVSEQVARHAPCPVVIHRTGPSE
jgi:nucleotide-binding universal stress UspA family protein